mmetsp:Transcript_80207/g.158888  ORF Transcript_80207/g.158888 Transcript_80207/m.158888 type:complete len:103 (-) Transcript_80207:1788-2096(-)
MDHSQISRDQGFLSERSQLHPPVVGVGCKLACETALLSSLSFACYDAPGEVLDQNLVVAEACASYKYDNCWRALGSYRWRALDGNWLRLFKQLWKAFRVAGP